jgi:hypothetical protein
MRLTSIHMALMVGLVTLAALAVPRPAGAFDPPKDPCAVLTTQEVSAALGGASADPKHVVATQCEWDLAAKASGPPKKVTLDFLSTSAWEQTRALREHMQGSTHTNVDGLGEEAVFSSNSLLCTLQVKKGSAVLDIHLYGFPPDVAKAKQIELAKAALGRF